MCNAARVGVCKFTVLSRRRCRDCIDEEAFGGGYDDDDEDEDLDSVEELVMELLELGPEGAVKKLMKMKSQGQITQRKMQEVLMAVR